MKKQIMLLTGTVILSLAVLLTACSQPGRTVSVSSENSDYEEEETTKKSKKDDEEETTKKSKKDDEEETTKKSKKDDEEETTKKSKKDDEEETTTKKSKKDEEEETTKKSSKSDEKTGWKKYSGTGYAFSIDADTWKKALVAGADLAFEHPSTSADGFKENINVMIQDTSGYDIDLEGYKELSLEQYKQLGYDLINIKKMTVNGQAGYYVITSVEEDGTVCMVAQYFTMVDDDAYIFTFVADEDDFDDLEDEVVEIFGTIEFD